MSGMYIVYVYCVLCMYCILYVFHCMYVLYCLHLKNTPIQWNEQKSDLFHLIFSNIPQERTSAPILSIIRGEYKHK